MKKSLLALAVLGAFAGTAHAQSSVTMYGSIDAGIRNLTNTDIAGDSKLTMGSTGTYNSNRIGFKGVEDLGGGLNAHFTLESGFNTATGALDNTANVLFNRNAFVGLGGSWGTVDMGRQYTVAFKTIAAYDPLNYKFPSIALSIPATAGVKNNNDVQYTGNFGGLTVRGEYALGEVAGSTGNSATQAVGLGYAGDAYNVGGAYTQKKTATGLDYKHYTLGGAYTLEQFKFSAGYANERQATATVDMTNKYAWAGASYLVSPALKLTAAYYRLKNNTDGVDGAKGLSIVAADYALSKSTSLYAGIDKTKVSGTLIPASTKTNQLGISAGINHFF